MERAGVADSAKPDEVDIQVQRPGLLRRLYVWMLHWADTRYGSAALAAVSFTESSFFPIPPDPLLMAVTLARPGRAWFYGLLCTFSSVLGGLLGYWIGLAFMETVGKPIVEFYGQWPLFLELQERFQEYGFFAVLIAALTPIPYKVFTIASGACVLSLPTFVAASLLGRGLRFLTVAFLIGYFGEPIRRFIDRYFNLLCFLFLALLILGFLALRVFK
ncbi:MAG: YqaA family protein [Planctomycetota bacterium]